MVTVIAIALLLAGAQSEMLEMTVTGPDAVSPGISVVWPTGIPGPATALTDLPLMPGWPKSVANALYAPSRGVALADLDGDNRLEVIMPTGGGRVYVWRHDGSDYPGWPVSLVTDSCQYAAAVADVDLDGELDIAVGTRSFTGGDGPVYLFTRDGNVSAGWPFRGGGGYFNESPTLVDIDGDDTLEVIACERRGVLGYLWAVRHDGRVQPGSWPQVLDHVPATGAAAADLDGDGAVEIVQCSYNSMYVFSADGTLRAGWPVTTPNGRNWSYQSPALADIDGDDTLEIVTAMHKEGGGAYVLRHDGTIQAGWPQTYPNWTYCPPTVADLGGDGELRVLCGVSAGVSGYSNVLYAHDRDGGYLPGFPYSSQTGSNEPNLTVADLDGDGDMEVLLSSNRITSADSLGYLYALHHDGSEVTGFPLRPWGFTYLNGANVADMNGDGLLDIVAVSAHADRLDVTIWEAGVPFSRTSWEWPTYQFDMQRTGRYQAAMTGVSEPGEPGTTGRPAAGSIVRGVLHLPGTGMTDGRFPVLLLDAAGRRVMELRPGGNNVARLAPGVYFVRRTAGAGSGAVSVTRVVITG
jgi:hypothetical protein